MQQQPLQRVIDTEDEIRRKVTDERARAAAWLDSVRLRCEREKETERQRLETSFKQAVEEARQQRLAVAERLLADAKRQAGALRDLKDAVLLDTLRRHLGAILPVPAAKEDG
jgi:hypothetical protein